MTTAIDPTAGEGALDVSITQLIRDALEFRIADLHVGMPGRIEAWNPILQQADVQPLLKRINVAIDGSRTVVSFPKLINVPVAFPRGGGWRITWALAPGDLVELRFMERSIDGWAGTGLEVEPKPPRKHHLSDAIAVPALASSNKPIPDLASPDLVIGREDGTSVIRMKPDGTIELGTLPTLGVARITDPTTVDSTSDPAMIGWMAAITEATLNRKGIPADAAVVTKFIADLGLAGVPPNGPMEISGTITGASAKVKAVG